MKIDVEIISKEIVKPSSPTPQHLRHYHLSFLDQLCPSQVNNSWVYFFSAHQTSKPFNIADASNRLKKSLSQVLSYFYPLAGRLTNTNFVDCNDDGVPYIETRVSCLLGHIIDNPSPADVSKFLPYEMDEALNTVAGVQVNVFDCGGLAIGVSMPHKVGDALSYFHFVKSWAAVCRAGEPEQNIRTHFQSSLLFPPKDISGYNRQFYMDKIKTVSRRFVFETSVIESLRAKHSEKMKKNDLLEGAKQPSRIEVLSTFIWTRFQEATKEEGSKKNYLVAWTVNLRPRMDPPLPEHAFGNYSWLIRTFPTLDEKGECNDLGRKLREELSKIDKDFIVELQEGEEWMIPQSRSIFSNEEIVAFAFTSLCWFPVYEVDFGWGNPVWAGPPAWKFKNVVIFKDTVSGDGGIEAFISLTEEDMAKLEGDEEFLEHVSTTGINIK
ncbi:hypothetical protein QN277_024987 [Acacia crassicarpa]|uniref:Uncharacterized protein n=1 Tax=Acacia crassicarpa TaxID=499986 RepID=A0AAE1MHX3_9FABA|nr:hypothetical protein QN277_024987 [Acacia crassicarpa]